MLRSILPAALLAVVAFSPAGAAAQTPETTLRQARDTVNSMKRSASKVRQLSSTIDSNDRVVADCVTESSQAIQQNVEQAEATIDAAVGWGPDVAAAVAKAVSEARTAVATERAQAFECAGVEDEEALADLEGEPSAEDDAEDRQELAEADREQDAFDPFARDVASGAGSVALSNRDPAASPTK